jgi:hypothetical protein
MPMLFPLEHTAWIFTELEPCEFCEETLTTVYPGVPVYWIWPYPGGVGEHKRFMQGLPF